MRKHTISLDTKIRIQCLEDKHENILNNIFYQPFQKQYELLSKHSWNFDLNYENELQFKFTVPASLFNPYVSICSHAFLELIFENKIPLKNLDVADVGCGCGIIGLSAILKGAKSVTFSDIDQDINIIKKNPLFDSSACSVKIRSLLSKEKSKFDVVFFSFPINASNEKRFNSSHIGGAFDFFTHAVFSDIEKSLNENGKFVGSAICEEHDIVKVEKFLVQNSNFTSFNILSLHDSLQFLLSRWHSVPRVFYQFFFKRKQPLLFLIYSCLRE